MSVKLKLLAKLPGWLRRRLAEGAIRKWLKSRGATGENVKNIMAGYKTIAGAVAMIGGGIALIANGIANDFDFSKITEGITAIGGGLALLGIRFSKKDGE